MTDKTKPISGSNPPESRGVVKDTTPPKIVQTDNLKRFEEELKKEKKSKKKEE